MTTTPERTHGRLLASNYAIETVDASAPHGRRTWRTTPGRWHVITSEHGRVVSVDLESDWAMGQHRAVRAAVTGLLLQVLDHHAPSGRTSGVLECTGCDRNTHVLDGRPVSTVALSVWPCTTWQLIANGANAHRARQVDHVLEPDDAMDTGEEFLARYYRPGLIGPGE